MIRLILLSTAILPCLVWAQSPTATTPPLLEPDPVPPKEQPAPTPKNLDRYFTGSASLYGDFSSGLNGTGSASAGGQEASANGHYGVDPSVGLGVAGEYVWRHDERLGSGVELGLDYNLPRTIISSKLAFGGTNFQLDHNEIFNSVDIRLSYKFYFRDFYGLAGINLPFLSIDGTHSDFSGQLGYQVGVGYRFYRNFSVDLQYRVLNARGSLIETYSHVEFRESYTTSLSMQGGLLGLRYTYR